ncbi:MAG: glycoside hydrolase family 140 protein [Christensenellales bacterium]|jgi:hypothetical protein
MKKPWSYGPLAVSQNKRYLINGSRPFFWLGDTAWLLFEKLSFDEARTYLVNRRDKGFNVIQATLVHTIQDEGENAVCPSGLPRPFLAGDFSRPDMDGGYWQNVDAVVKEAENLGIYMALLPSWGSMVKTGRLNEDNAEGYARFLAERYGNCDNVIFLLGGDIRGNVGYDVFMKLGETLKSLCPQRLVGFHPFGRTTSSFWFDDAPWLDFNMFQSGHRRYDQMDLGLWDDNTAKEGFFGQDSWRYVRRDYECKTKRPTLDGEPSYEQIPQGLHDPKEPYWQDHDIRRYAWWSVLEGACGHTFGHNAIMQFFAPPSVKASYGVKSYWFEALHDPGAGQMGHMASFMNALDFTNGAADESLLADGQKEKYDRVSAFAGDDFAVFYSYTGDGFAVDLSSKGWQSMDAWWFDPAQDTYSYIGSFPAEKHSFNPTKKPTEWNDWILLLKKTS